MANPEQPRDFKGRWTHDLIESLQVQLEKKGHTPDAAQKLAIEILTDQGSLDKQGNLTAQGVARQTRGKEGRAKDRAARQTGHNPEHYFYAKGTGKTYLK